MKPLAEALTRRALLLGSAAASFLGLSQRARAADVAGAVADVSGSASVQNATGGHRKLAASDPVHIGEEIKTSAQSILGLRLEHGVGLRLGADGGLALIELTSEGGGKLALAAGPLLVDRATPTRRGVNAGGNDPGLLIVETPYCTVTLGGDTRAFVGPSKEIYGVFVDRGSVTVVSGGKRVRLKQGEGTDLRNMRSVPTSPARWRSERIRIALDSVRAAPPESAQPQSR